MSVLIFLLNFLFTLFMYMFIPFLIVGFRKKPTTKKEVKLFSVLNVIFIFIVFTIFNLAAGEPKLANIFAALFWHFITYNYLEWKLIDNAVVKTTEDVSKSDKAKGG